MKCGKANCAGSLVTLASGQSGAGRILVDGTSVYWTTSDQLMKCAIAGCGGAPAALASGQTPGGIALDDAYLYWTSGTSVLRVAK
jgi:hypothetical protein